MNIVIVTKEEFPYGGAASNRVLTYMPGLVALGHQVTILCLFLSRKENVESLDENGECFFQGIRIKYAAGKIPWPVGKKAYLTKVHLRYKARRNAKRFLEQNKKVIDVVQMYSTEIELYERYGKICRYLGLKYCIERSELPDIIKYKEKYDHSEKGAKYIERSENAFSLFDGWILETQTLVDYYQKFFRPGTKCAIVPMTVDVERFTIPKSSSSQYGRYIAYCGNMGEIDGISILIKAFGIILSKYPDVKLVLAGDSTDVPMQKQLVESLGIEDSVVFLGRVSRDVVPQFLADATILALASPTSDRACASMPCKVGEYLCTGNPVVVTGLGEINKYLEDGVSAYLSKPDSAEAFAEKLEEVLSDTEKACTIGLVGKEVAINNFSSEEQVKRIEGFYSELIDE